ncbi:1-phosphofructokinase [Geomicrobium sp. JCM 19038]|uniref:1-phosphofructokinase n=1 Tax=Geomicrobium sp. JCM 19038 TaxID=1460635 RepID=UPI00045F2F77|nr:1-phosphofructokinase [Geomicrobium sp. JCM 19038]GAK07600.1 1-phosphofructokinase [Geomicrobium sp. JCM 19038]
MIYTVTLNPAIDYIVNVTNFETARLNRSEADDKQPGGKGINVSRVLQRLGIASTATGFVGGFTGEYIRSVLTSEGIAERFVSVDGDTRLNIKLKTLEETEINGRSPVITQKDLANLEVLLLGLTKEDTVVFAGSVPESVDQSIYHKWIKLLSERGVRCYLDANGSSLKEALAAKPYFVKPNHHELSELYNRSIVSLEDVYQYGSLLKQEYNIPHVIVSMASRGALYFAEDQRVYHYQPPRGNVLNSVGAGDSVVAGFIYAKHVNDGDLDAVRFAVACGSASAFQMGFCNKQDVLEMYRKTTMKNWEECRHEDY